MGEGADRDRSDHETLRRFRATRAFEYAPGAPSVKMAVVLR